jgi:molybdate transport system permease protein
MRRLVGRTALLLPSTVLVALLTLPLLALLIRGLQTQSWQIITGEGIPEALFLSLLTTSATAALTIVFGTPLAYLLARRSFRLKRLLVTLIELPVVLPPAVAGLALLVAFGRRGLFGPILSGMGVTLPFTPAAVVLAQMFIAAPFYLRAAQVGFSGVEREIEDAARVDGAGGWSLFRAITLPLAFRSLAAGLSLCWARAMGEFGATILFAGSLQGRTETMPLLIYKTFERDIDAAIWTGLLLIGFALIGLLAARRFERAPGESP